MCIARMGARIGRMTTTFLVSIPPVIGLCGDLPYSIAIFIDYPETLTAILGNMVSVLLHPPPLSAVSKDSGDIRP